MSWREDVELLPNLSPTEFNVALGSVALVIIDMQYVDAHRDYGLGEALKQSHPEVWDRYFGLVEEVVTPNCSTLLELFRNLGELVIHVTYGPELPDGSDLVPIRRRGIKPPGLHPVGSFVHKILPPLEPREGELVINKTSRSVFNSTAIETVLRNVGVETVIVVGVTTSSCVETTARDAADRGFQTVVVEDAVGELDEDSHNATLRQIAMRFGRVWTTEQVIAELRELAPSDASDSVLAR